MGPTFERCFEWGKPDGSVSVLHRVVSATGTLATSADGHQPDRSRGVGALSLMSDGPESFRTPLMV